MTHTHRPPPARSASPSVVSIVLGLLVSWFAWPAKELEPRDLPVVVAGPAPAAAALAQQLASARPARSRSPPSPTRPPPTRRCATARRTPPSCSAPTGLSLHTASGASPTVAALLTQAAQQLGRRPARRSPVVDVVPGAPDDPRGAGFASGYLPLVLASMVAGILLAVAGPRRGARLVGLVAFAPCWPGSVGAGVLHGLGVLDGGYLAAAGAVALLALAVERDGGRARRAARAGRHRARRAARVPVRQPDLGRRGRARAAAAAVGRDRPAAAARRRGDPAALGRLLRRGRLGRRAVDTARLGRRRAAPWSPWPAIRPTPLATARRPPAPTVTRRRRRRQRPPVELCASRASAAYRRQDRVTGQAFDAADGTARVDAATCVIVSPGVLERRRGGGDDGLRGVGAVMEWLRLVLLYAHLIGFALLLGGAVAQYLSGKIRINAAMLWGAGVQVVTGVAWRRRCAVAGRRAGRRPSWRSRASSR